MKVCLQCGNKVSSSEDFCSRCGSSNLEEVGQGDPASKRASKPEYTETQNTEHSEVANPSQISHAQRNPQSQSRRPSNAVDRPPMQSETSYAKPMQQPGHPKANLNTPSDARRKSKVKGTFAMPAEDFGPSFKAWICHFLKMLIPFYNFYYLIVCLFGIGDVNREFVKSSRALFIVYLGFAAVLVILMVIILSMFSLGSFTGTEAKYPVQY